MSEMKAKVLITCCGVVLLVWGAIYAAAFKVVERRLSALEISIAGDIDALKAEVSLQGVYIQDLRVIMIKQSIDIPPMPRPRENETDER